MFDLSPETLCNLKQSYIVHCDPSIRYTSSKWRSHFQQLAIKKPQNRHSLQGILKFSMNTQVCRMHKTNMITAVHILLDIWGQLLSDPSPHVRVDTRPLRALPPDVTRITCRQFTKENGTQNRDFYPLTLIFSTKILCKCHVFPPQSRWPVHFTLFHFITIRHTGKEQKLCKFV